MDFTTHNTHFDMNGSYKQGELHASYEEIVKSFGEPLAGDRYKTDAEWLIRFEDGELASVYNYKNGEAYNGKDGIPLDDIEDWSIGGFSPKVVQRIQQAVLGSSRRG